MLQCVAQVGDAGAAQHDGAAAVMHQRVFRLGQGARERIALRVVEPAAATARAAAPMAAVIAAAVLGLMTPIFMGVRADEGARFVYKRGK